MGAMRELNPDKINITVNAVPVGGFGANSMVKIKENAPRFIAKAGVDGEITRVKVLDRSAMVAITLMVSSESNAMFSALAAADLASSAGVCAVVVEDLNGLSIFAGEQCWIQEMPETEYGREPGENVWGFFVADLKPVHAGT